MPFADLHWRTRLANSVRNRSLEYFRSPEGTTYRLLDRRAAPASTTAATAGSTRSISSEADNERVESQNKRVAEAEAKAKAKEAKRKAQLEIQARTIAAPTPSEGDDMQEMKPTMEKEMKKSKKRRQQ